MNDRNLSRSHPGQISPQNKIKNLEIKMYNFIIIIFLFSFIDLFTF